MSNLPYDIAEKGQAEPKGTVSGERLPLSFDECARNLLRMIPYEKARSGTNTKILLKRLEGELLYLINHPNR